MFEKLEQLILEWADAKGIMLGSDPLAQFGKTDEEVTELYEAVMTDNKDEIKDAIGDIIVTLIVQANMQGFTINECVQHAYNIISKRTGKMANGVFVKDDN